jgi:hypothetical protein
MGNGITPLSQILYDLFFDMSLAVNQSLIQRGIFHCSQSLTESETYKIYNPQMIHTLLLFHEIYAEKTLLITLSAK